LTAARGPWGSLPGDGCALSWADGWGSAEGWQVSLVFRDSATGNSSAQMPPLGRELASGGVAASPFVDPPADNETALIDQAMLYYHQDV